MIKLQRNLETKRNKEQEDSFENTMNLSLFFASNEVLYKIDGWKKSNVKKLVDIFSKEKEIDVLIEYSRWTENVKYIFNNINVMPMFSTYELSEKEKQIFIKRDIFEIHEWIKNNPEKEKQFSLLMFLSEIIKNNKRIIEALNNVVNKGLVNLEFAINFTLPLLFIEDKNE